MNLSRQTLELLTELLHAQQVQVGHPRFEENVLATIQAKKELAALAEVEMQDEPED